MIYFTNETGSCKTTVQFWQKVHGVDITHDNVCSSMLSCFYSYVAATINRASISSCLWHNNYSIDNFIDNDAGV